MADDMHGGIFDSIGDMNHDGKVDMQDYHLWQDVCEEPEQDSEQKRELTGTFTFPKRLSYVSSCLSVCKSSFG